MKIRTLERVKESFLNVLKSREAYSPESDDQRIRGYSYTETKHFRFYFENEKNLGEEGYEYNLKIEQVISNMKFEAGEEDLLKNFSFISEELFKKGVVLLSHPAFMKVVGEFNENEVGEKTMTMRFKSDLKMFTNDDKTTTYEEMIRDIKNGQKKRLIALAVGAKTMLEKEYCVSLASLPVELFGKSQTIELGNKKLSDLLSSGDINHDDVRQFLIDFIEFVKEKKSYSLLNIDGLEEYIESLDEKARVEVLKYSKMTSHNLWLFKKYYINGIRFCRLSLAELEYLGIGILAQLNVGARSNQENLWTFIKKSIEHGLEAKVVENAYSLVYDEFDLLSKYLVNFTVKDLFKSVIRTRGITIDRVVWFFEQKYEGLNMEDYEACVRFLTSKEIKEVELGYYSRMRIDRFMNFFIELAFNVGADHNELANLVEDQARVMNVDPSYFGSKKLYEEFNFELGLKWKEEDRKRKEEEEQRKAKIKKDSNDAVIRFAQKSNKIMTEIDARSDFGSSFDVYDVSGAFIGCMYDNERKVLIVETSGGCDYIIDLDRVRKLRNGVLHVDVRGRNVGRFIGTGGSKVKELTKKMNELGCEIKTIKVHTF